jgi:hypothetical protein
MLRPARQEATPLPESGETITRKQVNGFLIATLKAFSGRGIPEYGFTAFLTVSAYVRERRSGTVSKRHCPAPARSRPPLKR